MIISGKARKRHGLFHGLAIYLVIECVPFLFRLTWHSANSVDRWGVPPLLSGLAVELFPAYAEFFAVSSDPVQHFAHALGMLVSMAIAIVSSRALLGERITRGQVEFSIAIWVVAGVAIAALIPPVINGMNSIFQAQQSALDLSSAPWPVLAVGFLSAVIIAPVAEEIIFRGFLANLFLKSYSGWICAVATSVLFTLSHGFTIFSPGRATALFAAGILLFAARLKFKGVGAPILIHFAANFAVFVLLPGNR